ncbi:MAG TPA: FlgD immunoglobulin-like domain containing protein [Phycisphaerae bacterium]|nr:FlgD immunoglobulin-like domain containing protein [Phycisphaerae bacterium]HRY67311.1 FlgD immunoglobulin-like domain containing protein [Phycisphaerae bacterium]HSA28454.1 FlgD immunoglobulin-like domain containing protein [Phycisphaerae bacterium]
MSLRNLCATLVVIVAAGAGTVFGNVYATNLSQSASTLDWAGAGQTVNLGYLLNEDATAGVKVEVLDSSNAVVRTFDIASQSKGSYSVAWNGRDDSNARVAPGNYSFRVTAAATGYGSWTEIGPSTEQTSFYSPRGVDVNKDPASKYYGRVYVAESIGGTTTEAVVNRTTQDGVYILNADATDAVGQGSTARTGGLTFGGSSSPFRLVCGPEDKVYLTDWSDSNSNLYVGNADFSSANELLDSTGRETSGKAANHGSIPTVYVEGVGASRTVYTMDEDFDAGTDTAHGGIGSILKYDVGAATSFTDQPSIFYDDGAHGTFKGLIQNYNDDMVRASDGTWWVSQTRSGGATDTLSSLIQISADGSTVLWKSVPDLAANSLVDPLKKTYGLAWDPVHDYLALATYDSGKIVIFDDDTKSVITTISFGGTACRDLAFDAVGNLYVVNNSIERLKIFSPGDGVNSAFTDSFAVLGSIAVTPEPATLLCLGLGALLTLRRRAR